MGTNDSKSQQWNKILVWKKMWKKLKRKKESNCEVCTSTVIITDKSIISCDDFAITCSCLSSF